MSKCLCLCNDLCVKKQTWVFEHFRSESSPRRLVITVGHPSEKLRHVLGRAVFEGAVSDLAHHNPLRPCPLADLPQPFLMLDHLCAPGRARHPFELELDPAFLAQFLEQVGVLGELVAALLVADLLVVALLVAAPLAAALLGELAAALLGELVAALLGEVVAAPITLGGSLARLWSLALLVAACSGIVVACFLIGGPSGSDCAGLFFGVPLGSDAGLFFAGPFFADVAEATGESAT